MVNTFSIETIIPDRGCSPVGSTQENFKPKSLKTELRRYTKLVEDEEEYPLDLREEAISRGRNEVNAIRVCVVIDLQLQRQR